MIAATVYVLCALTSTVCAAVLLRKYAATRVRLLLWSGLCFIGLALNNVTLVVDRLIVQDVDLSTWRLVPTVAGFAALLFGLVWDQE